METRRVTTVASACLSSHLAARQPSSMVQPTAGLEPHFSPPTGVRVKSPFQSAEGRGAALRPFFTAIVCESCLCRPRPMASLAGGIDCMGRVIRIRENCTSRCPLPTLPWRTAHPLPVQPWVSGASRSPVLATVPHRVHLQEPGCRRWLPTYVPKRGRDYTRGKGGEAHSQIHCPHPGVHPSAGESSRPSDALPAEDEEVK